MHLQRYSGKAQITDFPRMGGDAPATERHCYWDYPFPPHGRGCTLGRFRLLSCGFISPAWAGMHLSCLNTIQTKTDFPRMGGDAPYLWKDLDITQVFPPHGRGCTIHPSATANSGAISPAWAGMHLSELPSVLGR